MTIYRQNFSRARGATAMVCCAAALVLASCHTTPVATPAGLAQWYPPGQAPAAGSAQATAPATPRAQLPKPKVPKAKVPKPYDAKPATRAKPGYVPPRPKASASGMDELAFIRLQHRLKDLEEKYQQLWLKYQALEKGLALGLMPPEVAKSLNASLDRKTPPAKTAAPARAAPANPSLAANSGTKHQVVDPPAPATKPLPKPDSLAKGVKGAIAMYRKAKYGRALIAFQQLQKTYDPAQLGGNDHYWIGLCWYHLKDFSKARESLDVFQSRYPRHNLARKAALYQAKIDLDIGLTKKGVSALEQLIQVRPSDEVGKLARGEIESLNDELR